MWQLLTRSLMGDPCFPFEWDSRHGTVEQYDKTGKKHLGEFDPNTGEQVKPPNKKRSVEK